ncbi:MAG: M55 family metallopeptidase [Desulfobacterales bacterium]|nr:M55 family metallopeptidase [Desulfobacterales bacterium]
MKNLAATPASISRTRKRILIISDIEGSSGCTTREAAKFMGKGWPHACLDMTRDVNRLTTGLLEAGADQVVVQDFHRTAHNIFTEQLNPSVVLKQGYAGGPVPGLGNPEGFDGLMMVGMHAPSGWQGFLPHTLTSRITAVRINGSLVSEGQLFSAALSGSGIPPLFFSGCPDACAHTRMVLPDVSTFAIDKFHPDFHAGEWRKQLAETAVRALDNREARPYNPSGPFEAVVTMAGGKPMARRLAGRWGYPNHGSNVYLRVRDYAELYRKLARLVFLSPVAERMIPVLLPLYHLMGHAGLYWAKKKPLCCRNSDNQGA